MAKIYRRDSRISLNIDGLAVKISPLTFHQKMEVQDLVLEGTAMSAMKGAALALRYSLKDIKGLKDDDGDDYHLEVENDMVSEECIDDLFNIEQGTKLTLIALNLLQGVPQSFVDPNTGEPIEGVKVLKRAASGKKK